MKRFLKIVVLTTIICALLYLFSIIPSNDNKMSVQLILISVTLLPVGLLIETLVKAKSDRMRNPCCTDNVRIFSLFKNSLRYQWRRLVPYRISLEVLEKSLCEKCSQEDEVAWYLNYFRKKRILKRRYHSKKQMELAAEFLAEKLTAIDSDLLTI